MRYLFVIIFGTLLHFTYEWSGNNFIVGLFSPINESVWEHLKLLFFPMLLLTVWDYFVKFKKDSAFLPARVAGIVAGMGFIVTAYYTISGIIGRNINWIDIVIYFIGVTFAFLVERKMMQRGTYRNPASAIWILILLVVLFTVFTIIPPEIGLFKS